MAFLIQLVIVALVIGVIYWLITSVIPLPPMVRVVITVLLALVLIFWLLEIAGMLPGPEPSSSHILMRGP